MMPAPSATVVGGHDAGRVLEAITSRLMGVPRTTVPGHYEWDAYELKRHEDGSWIYLYVETRGCCYEARMPAQQPIPPELR